MKEEKQVAMELEWNWVEHVISVVFVGSWEEEVSVLFSDGGLMRFVRFSRRKVDGEQD